MRYLRAAAIVMGLAVSPTLAQQAPPPPDLNARIAAQFGALMLRNTALEVRVEELQAEIAALSRRLADAQKAAEKP